MAASYAPTSYAVMLYPGFEILDLAGPLEALNTLSRRKGQESMTLSVLAQCKEPISPAMPAVPPSTTPGSGFRFQSQQKWFPTHTFDNPPKIDVLIVPGGFGSLPPAHTDKEVCFIKDVYPSLQYLITVCTGAGLAAKAGVLDGHCATTNKSVWNTVTKYGPRTYWVGHARWVVSKNIWTTSGVSAGTDGMIAWLAHVFPEKLVEEVVNAMEYNREKNAWDDPFAKIYGAVDVPPTKWGGA